MMYVVKKDGTKEIFDVQKIVKAVNKSAARILYKFQDQEVEFICGYAKEKAQSLDKNEISIQMCIRDRPTRYCINIFHSLIRRMRKKKTFIR